MHLPGLHGIALRDRLAESTGLPVALHHDAAACALAEWRWGPNAGADGLAYLTCGTGFGVGLMLGGKVRYARDGRTPEIGHVRYRDEGPPIFGKPGCYEGYGSANALALLLRWRMPDAARRDARAGRRRGAQPTTPTRAGRCTRTNARSARPARCSPICWRSTCIVLGTLAAYLGEPWIDAVRDASAHEALDVNVERA